MTIPIKITRTALDALGTYAAAHGEHIEYEASVPLICASLQSFVETNRDLKFFQNHRRHSFCAASLGGNVGMDYSGAFFLHADRLDDGWLVGTPGEIPLPSGYEQERAIEEAAIVLQESEQ